LSLLFKELVKFKLLVGIERFVLEPTHKLWESTRLIRPLFVCYAKMPFWLKFNDICVGNNRNEPWVSFSWDKLQVESLKILSVWIIVPPKLDWLGYIVFFNIYSFFIGLRLLDSLEATALRWLLCRLTALLLWIAIFPTRLIMSDWTGLAILRASTVLDKRSVLRLKKDVYSKFLFGRILLMLEVSSFEKFSCLLD
jgi:hypothetical protein